MITRIEARGYRSLRAIDVKLSRFHLLVGPNGSGKSTLLDVPALIRDVVNSGIQSAIQDRGSVFDSLTWLNQGTPVELAVEFNVAQSHNGDSEPHRLRYELRIGKLDTGENAILEENLFALEHAPVDAGDESSEPEQDAAEPATVGDADGVASQRPLPFPHGEEGASIMHSAPGSRPLAWRPLARKTRQGSDTLYSETTKWQISVRGGHNRSCLATVPEADPRFAGARQARDALAFFTQYIALSGHLLKSPSAPGLAGSLMYESGQNIALVIEYLKANQPALFQEWLVHIQTAVRSLGDVTTYVRDEDRHRILVAHFGNTLAVPSWGVSDGTLRLLALTLIAFTDNPFLTNLIEEPENGIHPQAIECVIRAFQTSQRSQFLCATHSPVVVAMAEPEDILCFSQESDGATKIVPGNEHPRLRDWKRDAISLANLFASGVLS